MQHHFRSVATATDLPVMLYDVPGRTGLRIGAETYRIIGEPMGDALGLVSACEAVKV